jgi:hypothetical protein
MTVHTQGPPMQRHAATVLQQVEKTQLAAAEVQRIADARLIAVLQTCKTSSSE